MTRERTLEVWKVATTGVVAAHSARIERLGASGSWMCTTSKSPSSSQRPTLPAATGPKSSRAVEPL